MSRILLCCQGEPSEEALLIPDGKLFVSRDNLSLSPIRVKNLVIGTLECLLSESVSAIPTRLFSIEVESEERPKSISFDTIENMLLQYVAGHQANQFLAFLIDETNKLIRSLSSSQLWKKYNSLARRVFEAIQRLERLQAELGVGALQDLFPSLEQFHIVRYGRLHFTLPTPAQIEISEKTNKDGVVIKKKGEVLCRDGEESDCMYVLLEGSVYVQKGERTVGIIKKSGEAFGELSFFLHNKRTADVIAKEKCAVLKIDAKELPQFHKDHPLLFFHLGRTLARRVTNNLGEIEETQWISSEGSEVLIRKERDAIIEKLKGVKRLSPPTVLVSALTEIEHSISSVHF